MEKVEELQRKMVNLSEKIAELQRKMANSGGKSSRVATKLQRIKTKQLMESLPKNFDRT